MKRILLLLALTASLAAAQQPTYDFRSVSWGASVAQVKSAETAEKWDETDLRGRHIVGYKDVVGDLDCTLMYFFVADQLVRAQYVFDEKHVDHGAFVDDFHKIKNILIDKYGQPSADLTRWKNNLYHDHPDKWGQAVAAGHLNLGALWETTRSEIMLGLTGDNFEIKHMLVYRTKDLRHLEDDLDKAATDKKF